MIAQLTIRGAGDPWPTFEQVVRTLTFQAGYNTTVVLIAATLLGVAGGVVGSFALLRKRALTADALSHASLPGIALAFIGAALLGFQGRTLPILLAGAACTGVIGVVLITLIIRHTRLTYDAAIGIVLSVFFGAGIVLLSYIQTMPTGGQGGLGHFIYGQTAAMTRDDAVLMGTIALIAIVAATLLIKEFAVVCFDDAYASVTGWPVFAIDLAIMALVVLVTVSGLQAVGLILVVAMLIIPAAAARFWTDRLRTMVIVAAFIGAMGGYVGAATSSLFPRKPAGSVIVLAAGTIFAISMTFAPKRGVVAAVVRRTRLRIRIAQDHLLKTMYANEPTTLRGLAHKRAWRTLTARLLVFIARRRGFVEPGSLRLTEQGRRQGVRVARNHALWEQYLITHADVAPSHVDFSADMVEHVLTPETVARLESLLARKGAPP